jgi:flavin-dependent dehydrogenase
VLLLGDAAGYVEPFTGEGIAWALTAAMTAPFVAVRGLLHWSQAIEEEWTRLHRASVQRRQVLCRAMAWLLRRPLLVETAIRLLHRFPWLADPVVRRLNAPASQRAVTRTIS